MKCKNPQCNNILPDNALYCPVCGKKQSSTQCKVNSCSVFPSVIRPNEKVLLKWEGENVRSIKIDDTEYTASSKIYLYPSESSEYKIDFISEDGKICSKYVYVQVKENSIRKILIVSMLIIALVAVIIFGFINSSVIKTNVAEIVEVVVEKVEEVVNSAELEEVQKQELSKLNYDNNVKTYKINPSKKEFVDLGLPSGTLWATCNIGATKPEEFGHYFAWGEVTPKFYYDTLTYKWWYDGDLTKYSSRLKKHVTTLELSDDVANVNWGDSCRMPTIAELEELCEYTMYKCRSINGVEGCELTSKMNSNTIFFPKTGNISGNNEFSDLSFKYWSSQQGCYDNSYARCLIFDSKYSYYNYCTVEIRIGSHNRFYGLPIRPVKKKINK